MTRRFKTPSFFPVALTAMILCFGGALQAVDFARDIEPILRGRCLKCHGPERQEGRFRVDRRWALLAGGDSGEPAVAPGDAAASHLFQLVSGADPDLVMPPKGKRLSAAQVEAIQSWIQSGAPTPSGYGGDTAPVELTHWSLKPLRRPDAKGASIDFFIRRKLAAAGLKPSPPAPRRKLIRRLFMVMHGLLPTPEQVERFVNDTGDGAWARLVDEVLASPRYGERMATFWLDLVRFGETHGFETNRERPHAWHYRDWVIESFNSDKPYDRFVREQIAGDALGADIGTGFLVAGPYDLVKGQDPKLRLVQRMNELDDMINTTGTAFLGLTLGCARCHNHKFDPVTQKDYYSLQAIFAGVNHRDRELPPPPEFKARLDALEAAIKERQQQLRKFIRVSEAATILIDDADLKQRPGVEHLVKPAGQGRNPKGTERGFASDPGDDRRSPNLSGGQYTWWRNQPGRDLVVYRPGVQGRFRVWLSWGAGYASHCTNAVYLLDTDGDLSTREDRRRLAIVDQLRFADGTGQAVSKALWSGFKDAGVHLLDARSAIVLQGGSNGSAVTADVVALQPVLDPRRRPAPLRRRPAVSPRHNVERFAPIEAKFVRFTIEDVKPSNPCIDELEIFSGDVNVALASAGAKATSSGDFVHPKHRLAHINDGRYGNSHSWISAQLKNGWVQIELPRVERIDRIEWARDREGRYQDRLPAKYRIEAAVEPGQWRLIASSRDRLPLGAAAADGQDYDFASHPQSEAEQGRRWFAELNALRKELAALRETLKPYTKAYIGAFSQPGPTHRLYRGEPDQKREEVSPALIAALSDVSLPRDAPEQQRRLALADWIAQPDNPLTARVIVNRLWQLHFGEGIVDTPSDFGVNGARPTHPELLDWLAAELIESGWSLKHVHRLILRSDTWRQNSRPNAKAMKVDAGTRLWWRFPPRRIEAEGIRDAMLQVSGVLDLRMGGPGFSAFEVEMENVRHFHPKKSYGPEDWRRMIYMTKVRQEKDQVFGAFDCPDASQVVPERSRSTTPLQALNLLNSRFVMQQAGLFAERLRREAGESPAARIERAYALTFGRPPSAVEIAEARQFIESYGLVQFTRALFNANEFVFVP